MRKYLLHFHDGHTEAAIAHSAFQAVCDLGYGMLGMLLIKGYEWVGK
jgi:hypothetical protein